MANQEKVIKGLQDAIRHAKGEGVGTRVTHYGNDAIEDSCGCVFCDIGLKRMSGLHHTARGDFPCTAKQ